MRFFQIHKLFLIFTLGYFIFAFATYKDFGISADEPEQYTNGKIFLHYLQGTLTQEENVEMTKIIETPYNRYYTALLALINYKDYYEWYHLLNFITGYAAFLLVYLLGLRLFGTPAKAVVAPIILALYPSFLGHIPINTKDIPFASVFLLSVYVGTYVVDKQRGARLSAKNLLLSALFGLAVGLTASFRAIGFSVLAMLIYTPILYKKKLHFLLIHALIIAVCGYAALYVSYPLIQKEPIQGVVHYFKESASFGNWHNLLFIDGNFYTKEKRSQSYLPVYLLRTTPDFILVLFSAGSMFIGYRLVKNRDRGVILLGLIAFLVVVNFLLYFALNPVIYNSVRHYLFVMPLISLVCAFGLDCILSLAKTKAAKAAIYVTLLGVTVLYVRSYIQLHPYEYTFYNFVSGGLINNYQNYDSDYWSISYKEASQQLVSYLRTTGLTNKKVYPCTNSAAAAYYSSGMYTVTGDQQTTDFIVCDYVNNLLEKPEPKLQLLGTVTRSGVPLNYIYAK